MEGLEVKVKLLSETSRNKDFRTDSDFWTKELKKNPKLNYSPIGNLLEKAQYGVSIAMNEEGKGYPIYRMNEIHNMFCDIEVLKFADISKEELKTFKLNDKDVLFNRTNSYQWVGRTGIYRKTDERYFIFASYLVRLNPDSERLTPEYLTAFLSSKVGVWEIRRRSRQSINQTNVNPEEIKEIEIPLLSMKLQNNITQNFDTAHELQLQSKLAYTNAENILLKSLNFKDFKSSQSPTNIKNFSESFGKSGRLDAEYYQVKYEDYISLVTSYSNGFDLFENVCTVKDKNYKPLNKKEYKYIELSNIGKSGDITAPTIALGEELPTRARRVVATGDVIISSIEGSLDSCAIINDENNAALCSTGFYVANSNKINPETLLVLFKSKPLQSLLKRACSGTILTAFSKTELNKIPIPLINSETQEKIKKQVTESFQLKKQSEHLLEVAKRAVEIAIEEDEERALGYVEEQINYR